MNHIDEGTIHAWLDGALDAVQARQVEAHVAQCPACSALVADARGIMAAASRIMSALDDVPGGVIPKGASAAGPAATGVDGVTPIGSRRPRQGWRVTRWASAIAAVLVAAIVLNTSNKAARSPAEFAGMQAAGVDSAVHALSTASDAAPVAVRPSPERQETARSAPSAPAALPAPTPASGRGSATSIAKGVAGGTASSPLRSSAANPAPTAPENVAQRSAVADAPPTVEEGRAVASSARQDSARMRVSRVDQKAVESAVVTGLGASRDAQSFTGCYRLGPVDARAGLTQGASTAQRRGERAAAPSAAAAPQTNDFFARGLPSVVVLDTARRESGYTVRVATDSSIGSWRVVGDSARLDLGPRGVLMLSLSSKVPCP